MAEEIVIDVDFLITLVQDRPVLWDKCLDDFKNRDMTGNLLIFGHEITSLFVLNIVFW